MTRPPTRRRTLLAALAAAAASLAAVAPPARADEGMWLFNQPPAKLLKDRHGFDADPAWLEHLQKSAVRFGASASFVSPDGLMLTNHHVGRGYVQRLSSPDRDLLAAGFHARSREQEPKCPGAEARVLVRISDVTAKVNAAAAKGASPAEAEAARRAAVLSIEQAAAGSPDKLVGQVVTLYGGARFHLYEYRRFTDVRLVFAPEESIAFFGGDVDNFEFPRWDADFCLFRVYAEDGKPYRPEHYLKVAPGGAADGDLCFVAGHPGRTERALTLDHVKHLRDVDLPTKLRDLWRREVRLRTFADRDAELRRIAAGPVFGSANSRKASQATLSALQDPAFLAPLAADERALRSFVDADPAAAAKWAGAWDAVAAAQRVKAELNSRGQALSALRRSDLVEHALTIVRLAHELPKPAAERLREFGDADLPGVYHRLYAVAPIYDAMEREDLASGLAQAAETLGADDPLVAALLAGKGPAARAAELVAGTKL
ncbi:MAG TPA: S46 family peptidase, partial [Humisphaera sp.]